MTKTVALVGNPNCGKTTLFNALTGSNQYVGNWPGVTVEKKSGKMLGGDFEIVDLPGVYSLSPYSMEERVTADYIIKSSPSAIINIIDGTNPERNLYLTVQLIEANRPMVVAVNMMDEAEAAGIEIDCEKLSELVGIPFVPISAKKNKNIDRVIAEVEHVVSHKHIPIEIDYGVQTQNAMNEIYSLILRLCDSEKIPYNYYASRLLEGDASAADVLGLDKSLRARVEEIVQKYEKLSPCGDREAMLADARYKYIENLVAKTVKKPVDSGKPTLSDKIDSVVTNRFLAFPLFAAVMGFIFYLTFGSVGTFLSGKIEFLFSDILSPAVERGFESASAPEWTTRLVVEAVIGGVGGVLTFLPQICILFLCLSVLEDSGYMARAAFITDRFLRKLGLSGKSFIPMIMGFGCSTPAVMATRTQENMNERRMTIMLIPFMSCGAKLPIYALFAGVFFAAHRGLVVASMYLLGFVVAVLVGLLLKKTLFKANRAPFIMELPPYRMPMPKSVLKNTWEKCRGFIVKAGTIIFAMSVVIWVLQSFSPSLEMVENSGDSIFGIIGGFIAPLFKPLGFGNWKSAVALLSGLVAKEAVVSTMEVLNTGADLNASVADAFTPLSAFSFMAFSLLYVPCVSAFSTIKKEMGSLKWALIAAGTELATAYMVAFLIYRIGLLFI